MTAKADLRALLDDTSGPASSVTITVPGDEPVAIVLRAVVRHLGGRPPQWAGDDLTNTRARWADCTVHADDVPTEPVPDAWTVTDAAGVVWQVKDVAPRTAEGGAPFGWRLALRAGQRGGMR